MPRSIWTKSNLGFLGLNLGPRQFVCISKNEMSLLITNLTRCVKYMFYVASSKCYQPNLVPETKDSEAPKNGSNGTNGDATNGTNGDSAKAADEEPVAGSSKSPSKKDL